MWLTVQILTFLCCQNQEIQVTQENGDAFVQYANVIVSQLRVQCGSMGFVSQIPFPTQQNLANNYLFAIQILDRKCLRWHWYCRDALVLGQMV